VYADLEPSERSSFAHAPLGAPCSLRHVAGHAANFPADPAVVLTNPDEDCSPEAFRALINELLSEREPELESIQAADALRELRLDSKA
jgi:hypothetical protein